MKTLQYLPKTLKIYSNFSRKFVQKFRKIKKYSFVMGSGVEPSEASEFIKNFEENSM